jgi:hypothetical protein
VLQFAPSRRVAALLIGLHAGAALLLFVLAIPVFGKLLGGIALAMSFFIARRASHRLRELAVDSDGEWTIRLRGDGEPRPCVPTPHLITESLVLLSARREGRRWPLVAALASDSLENDAFRRLRARLRLRSPAA